MTLPPITSNPTVIVDKPLNPEVEEAVRAEMQNAMQKQFEKDLEELLRLIKSGTALDVAQETKDLAQKIVDTYEESNIGLLIDKKA